MNLSTDEQVRAIVDRVRAEVRQMARATAADEHLDLIEMPAEIRGVEAPHTARLFLARNLDALADGRELTAEELRAARERGTTRAQENFPSGLLLHYWSRGIIVLWERCVAAAEPGETAGLTEIASRLFGLQAQQLSAVAEAHHEARTVIDRVELGAPALTARLLIAGQEATAAAQQAGIDLAPTYDVLAVEIEPSPDEWVDRESARRVAGQRKVLRVSAALAAEGTDGLLVHLTPEGGSVLVPRAEGDDADPSRWRHLLSVMTAAAGAEVFAAVARADARTEIPEAASQAREVLRIARNSGLQPGLHDISSVPLAYQLSRPGAGQDHFARFLEPLEEAPELLETLKALLDRDGDRGRTARALGVHPNTVNNRLTRIRDLLDIDPVSTHGIVTLSAALTARHLSKEDL